MSMTVGLAFFGSVGHGKSTILKKSMLYFRDITSGRTFFSKPLFT